MKAYLFAFLAVLSMAGCSRAKVERVSYPIMGTVATLQARDAKDLPFLENSSKDVFRQVAKLLNRFDSQSEINKLISFPQEYVSYRKYYKTIDGFRTHNKFEIYNIKQS